jgi:hypothetical protein
VPIKVAGLDTSTRLVGVAWGFASRDAKPETDVWDLGREASRARRIGRLITRVSVFLKDYAPDVVVIEAPLNLQAAAKASTGAAWALIGVAMAAEAVCDLRGVPRVHLVDVQDVRAHFLGQRTFRDGYDPVNKRKITARENAKAAVISMCRMRGWQVKDDNAADAAALWSWGCAKVDPRLAAFATPLFQRRG